MNRRTRRGMTLLEMIIASSMLALVVTSISVIMRSGSTAWSAHQSDYTRLQAAHATLRHIVRNVRQADAVASVSSASDNSGSLSLYMPNGEVHAWDHDDANDAVYYGIAVADKLLALDIDALRFEGYEADGVTPTAIPGDIQCLRIEVAVQLPVDTNPQRTISSWAWVRTW